MHSWILSVRPATETGLPSVDVAVRARPDATVVDLARSLGRHLAPDQRTLLLVPHDGGQLWPAERRLSECGLRTGDLVDVGPAPGSWRDRPAGTSGARAVLRVVDGPDRGARVRVAAGQATIGRAAGCTLRLTDPQVSQRHARIELGPRPVVHDEGSANGTTVAGAPAAASQVDWGTAVRLGGTTVVVEPGDVQDAELPVSVFRPPRFGDPLRDELLDLPAPPSRNRPTPLPWAMLMLPMVMGAAILMRSHALYALVYMLAWPILGGLGWWQQRRTAEKQFQEELAEWRIDVEEMLDLLDEHALRQRERMLDDFPDEETLRARAASRDPYLWARAEDRSAFLTTRVGIGPVAAMLRGEVRDGGDRKERRKAVAEVHERDVLEELPVLADLTQHALVAITGVEASVDSLARAMLLRIAFDHSPAEISIAACLGRSRRHHEAWLRWLPHTAARIGGDPPVAVGSRASTALLEHLVSEGEGFGHTICVVDEDAGVPRRTVEAVAQAAAERGVHLLWLGRKTAEVPAATGLLVDLEAGRVGIRDRMGIAQLDVQDGVSLDHAWRHARSVTAYVDEAAVLPPSTAIPSIVRLPEVSSDLEDLDEPRTVLRRWQQASGLRAQIGRGVDGTVTVDLREDGPHGLVAGTTGSGKSELLQSLICSLALNNPPERITFLLVDYKGGAAFRECADLPHTVGYITDLTPALVARALTSLGAEITAREELLGRYEVKDLIQLERENPEAAPPSLLICVDEFAALTKEVPEFVDGMVNLAQRGRSLGMHLLLATQRPAGVVSGPIRANTDLRIALRVASPDDSRDVMDSPEAARISRRTPGRAWVRRTGHGTAELVQSAWTGARAPLVGVEDAVVVQPFAATTSSQPETQSRADVRLDPRTDLERCVRSIQEAFVLSEAAPPHRPWLPSLPSELLLNAEEVVRVGTERGTGRVRLGLLDDPAAQAQPDWVVDLAAIGHLLVHGASGSGKTELLRTTALSASVGDASGPEGVPPYVYAIDYAGGGLTAIAGLPTVAAVVARASRAGCCGCCGCCSAPPASGPRRWPAAAAPTSTTWPVTASGSPASTCWSTTCRRSWRSSRAEPLTREHLDHFQQVLQNGRRVGVHVVATAPGRVGVPTTLASSFGARVILRMPTADDYLMLGVPSKLLDIDTPPGAGLVGRRLIQVATTGGVGTPVQADRIRALGDRVAEQVQGRGTAPVPPMPSRVEPEALPAPEGTKVPVGVDADAVAPIVPDLLAGPLLIAGRSRSGRTSALDGIEFLAARSEQPPYVVRSHEPLQASERLQSWLDANPERSGSWALVLVDGAEGWDTRAMADLGVSGAVASIVKACTEQADRVALVVTADIAQARQRGGPEGLVAAARRGRRGFLLQPEWNDGDLFGITVPNRTIEPLTGVGRGLWCEHGSLRVAQLVDGPGPQARSGPGSVVSTRTPASARSLLAAARSRVAHLISSRPERSARGTAELSVLVIAGSLIAGALFGTGLSRTSVDVGDGLTWFADSPSGEVIQVNPATGRPETRIDVGAPGNTLDLAQYAGRLIVTNRTSGELVSFDLASILTSGQRRVTPGAATDVLHHGDDVFLVDRERGTIAAIDPVSTDTIGEIWASPDGISDAVVDGTGKVWSVNQKGVLSELRWSASSGSFVTEEERHVDHSGSRSVLVGHDQGVTLFGPDQGIVVQVGTGQADEVVAGAPRLSGELAVPDFAPASLVPVSAPQTGTVAIISGGSVHEVDVNSIGCESPGRPESFQGTVYVPCPGDAKVVRLDSEGARAAEDIELPDGGEPSLVLDDGVLLINVPGAEHGVAVAQDGSVSTIVRLDDSLPPVSGDPADAPIVAPGTVDDVANDDASGLPVPPPVCVGKRSQCNPEPSDEPTFSPTPGPSGGPGTPTSFPSSSPTGFPTSHGPSSGPSAAPSSGPSDPGEWPTSTTPTSAPTDVPLTAPTGVTATQLQSGEVQVSWLFDRLQPVDGFTIQESGTFGALATVSAGVRQASVTVPPGATSSP